MSKEFEIYTFCSKQWDSLIKRDGGYSPSKHDDIVFSLAAEKFDLTPEEVDEVYQRVSNPIEQMRVKGMTKEEMAIELERIITLNKDL